MTPDQLSGGVREAFAYAARYVSLLVANNPLGGPAQVLGRPDVETVLQDALDQGRELAGDAVREAWGGGAEPQYLAWLLDDIDRFYASPAVLRADIRAAWNSVPQAAFTPGVTPPGASPAMDAARERAEAVRNAILAYGEGTGLRSRLSAEVAATASRTAAELAGGEELAEAGEAVYKQWLCSSSPPDEKTCHWCRILHGMVIPLHASFPAGVPVDLTGNYHLTHPPRWYRGWRLGPPRHPRCRCRIAIITSLDRVPSEDGGQEASPGTTAVPGAGGADAPVNAPPGFLAAASIRALPEDRYRALAHFLEAAVHELGQVLVRLRGLLSLPKPTQVVP